ncbi:multidrug ABC transporter [bacterium]|nr:multidrug ABC transporter [bacterium]
MEGNWWYIIVAINVLVCSSAQLLLKKSAEKNHESFFATLFNMRVITAYFFFFCSIPINILAMQHGVLLKDMPILESLGYIFVPVLSLFFIGEKLTSRVLFSMFMIVLGIFIFYK